MKAIVMFMSLLCAVSAIRTTPHKWTWGTPSKYCFWRQIHEIVGSNGVTLTSKYPKTNHCTGDSKSCEITYIAFSSKEDKLPEVTIKGGGVGHNDFELLVTTTERMLHGNLMFCVKGLYDTMEDVKFP